MDKNYIEPTGPGVYGGPADERTATDSEADELKAAGWHELYIETLWRNDEIDPGGQCLFSVDEALAHVRRKKAEV